MDVTTCILKSKRRVYIRDRALLSHAFNWSCLYLEHSIRKASEFLFWVVRPKIGARVFDWHFQEIVCLVMWITYWYEVLLFIVLYRFTNWTIIAIIPGNIDGCLLRWRLISYYVGSARILLMQTLQVQPYYLNHSSSFLYLVFTTLSSHQ